jgi:hypothetical protein
MRAGSVREPPRNERGQPSDGEACHADTRRVDMRRQLRIGEHSSERDLQVVGPAPPEHRSGGGRPIDPVVPRMIYCDHDISPFGERQAKPAHHPCRPSEAVGDEHDWMPHFVRERRILRDGAYPEERRARREVDRALRRAGSRRIPYRDPQIRTALRVPNCSARLGGEPVLLTHRCGRWRGSKQAERHGHSDQHFAVIL